VAAEHDGAAVERLVAADADTALPDPEHYATLDRTSNYRSVAPKAPTQPRTSRSNLDVRSI